MKSVADVVENPSVKKETKSFRERTHRISNLSVKEIMRIKMYELNIKNVDLQRHLGFPTPNVISMMKNGTMRVPIQHAPKIAALFEIDKLSFVRKVVEENDPTLWDALESCLGVGFSTTSNENKLLSFVRKELDGHDPDLTSNEDFISDLQGLIAKVVKQEIQNKEKLLSMIDSSDKTD
jgi:hypothetical protein